jgi:hypothetical protein
MVADDLLAAPLAPLKQGTEIHHPFIFFLVKKAASIDEPASLASFAPRLVHARAGKRPVAFPFQAVRLPR